MTILLDAADDAAVTAALLAAHDPAAGHVTVHPTPSTLSPHALSHDLLVALGRPPERLAIENVVGATRAWPAAAAWMIGDEITQLTVLRAHRLPVDTWERLVWLQQCTGVRLVLVCHTSAVPAGRAGLLEAIAHRTTTSLAEALPAPAAQPPARPTVRPTAVAPGAPDLDLDLELAAPDLPLPRIPRSEVTHFRADAYRRLTAEEFARLDAVYAQGLQAACAWLAAHPHYPLRGVDDVSALPLRWVFPPGMRPGEINVGLEVLTAHYRPGDLRALAEGLLCVGRDGNAARAPYRWDDTAGLQIFLSSLGADSPSPQHTIARVRGAQAGFLLHGLLLRVPAELDRCGGPGMDGTVFTAATSARIRAHLANPVYAAALATALFTGMPPDRVAHTPISALSPDAVTLRLPDRAAGGRLVFVVPTFARGLLRAARVFLQFGGAEPDAKLFSGGLGRVRLSASAAACGLPLPPPISTSRPPASGGLGLPWHAQTNCWWVTTPLHEHAGQPTTPPPVP